MRISVIMTTYNSPRWLEKVLIGFDCQSLPPDEILVADDGSTEATRAALEALCPRLSVRVVHCWQPDDDFRKCQALNHGLLQASGDYCVFTDADCIPHPDFIAWHAHLARPGRFLSGGYNKLSMATSETIGEDDIRAGRHCDPAWLAAHGSPQLHREAKLRHAGRRSGLLLDWLTTTRPSWNGHNASTWRRYALQVNGFDHRMQYGGQDREFGERLENAGIRGLQIRHRATCVHLDHKRGYATPESIARNKGIRAITRKRRLTRCEQGIEQLDRDELVVTHYG